MGIRVGQHDQWDSGHHDNPTVNSTTNGHRTQLCDHCNYFIYLFFFYQNKVKRKRPALVQIEIQSRLLHTNPNWTADHPNISTTATNNFLLTNISAKIQLQWKELRILVKSWDPQLGLRPWKPTALKLKVLKLEPQIPVRGPEAAWERPGFTRNHADDRSSLSSGFLGTCTALSPQQSEQIQQQGFNLWIEWTQKSPQELRRKQGRNDPTFLRVYR